MPQLYCVQYDLMSEFIMNYNTRRYKKCFILLALPIIMTLVTFTLITIYSKMYNEGVTSPDLAQAKQLIKVKDTYERWIVVTSISLPTPDIEMLNSIDGWKLLVIGDRKTPKNWSLPGAIFIGIEQQEALGYKIVNQLPTGSYTRKNIGYLYAIEHGAKFIYDTDDDNHPTDNLTHFQESFYTTGIIQNGNKSLFFNPYTHFGQPSIWPRGYPLDLIADPSNNTYVTCRFKTPSVQQGVVNGDPDVDAVFRLTRKSIGIALNLTFDVRAPRVTLPVGVFAPYNSQNTFHSYKALWSLLLPKTVAFRVTDIWRGYWAQRLLWLIGDVLAFHPPNAYQKRNSHNYLADFVDEEEMYHDSRHFVTYLSTWKCERPSTFFQCVSRLSHDMANMGFWEKGDADLTDAWLADLVAVGYKEPPIVSYSINGNEQLCLDPDQSTYVIFSPVLQNTSYLVPPDSHSKNYPSSELNLLPSLCAHKGYKLPNASPSYVFSNILLVIVFNNPNVHAVPLLHDLYIHHFPNIVYCADIKLNDWDRLHRYSFINSTSTKGNLGYECAEKAIEMRYDVEGYFVIENDVLLNFWKLRSMDIHQVLLQGDWFVPRNRYSNETNWGWWQDPNIGRSAINAFLDDIEMLSKYHPAVTNDVEDQYLDRTIAINKYIENRYKKNLNMTMVSLSLGHVYYVPGQVSNIFYHVAKVLRKNTVFLEIAVSTVLNGILPTEWTNLPGHFIDGTIGDRYSRPMEYYNKSKAYLHPVKLGILLNDTNFTDLFCDTYIPEFIENW